MFDENALLKEYDRAWETEWGDMKKYGPFSRHVRRILFQIIAPLHFKTVLDIGCGQGDFLDVVVQKFPGIHPYGADLSSVAVALAQERMPQGEFWCLDITQGYLDRTFDLVICSEVLEHISDDVQAIKNIAAMTGQYLVISTPQGRMRGFERTVGHVRNYARGELQEKLIQCDFNVLKTVEWGFPFYSPLYRDFLDLTGSRGTTGSFGRGRKWIAHMMYYLFALNSARIGDELFVLAAPNAH